MKLKDMIHDFGLTMDEFRRLDPETQQKWRDRQAEKNRQQQLNYQRFLREEWPLIVGRMAEDDDITE